MLSTPPYKPENRAAQPADPLRQMPHQNATSFVWDALSLQNWPMSNMPNILSTSLITFLKYSSINSNVFLTHSTLFALMLLYIAMAKKPLCQVDFRIITNNTFC
jgi:hypothetical protein